MQSRRCGHRICLDRVRRLFGERGNAMPEYVVLIAVLAVVIMASLSFLGPSVGNPLTDTASAVETSDVVDSDDDDSDDDDSDDDDSDDDDSDDDDSDD